MGSVGRVRTRYGQGGLTEEEQKGKGEVAHGVEVALANILFLPLAVPPMNGWAAWGLLGPFLCLCLHGNDRTRIRRRGPVGLPLQDPALDRYQPPYPVRRGFQV